MVVGSRFGTPGVGRGAGVEESDVGGPSADSKMEEGARSPRGGGRMGREALGFFLRKSAAKGSRGGARLELRKKLKIVRRGIVGKRWCGGRCGGW